MKKDGAKIILNDLTLDSSQETGTWNSYDVTFLCPVELNNVNAEKAIAFENDATLNNVTINETHEYYAIWITANGQNVSIDGLTIDSAGRGIKIDEQYIDAPKKVALDVKNATFKTKSKAAILVKSAAGAQITANNVDITNVAADKTNLVWVDEDSADSFGKVEVTGGNLFVEAGEENYSAKVTSGEKVVGYYATLQAAVDAAEDNAVITILEDKEYSIGDFNFGTVTIKAAEGVDVVFEVPNRGNSLPYTDADANVTFENITFDYYPNGDYNGLQYNTVKYNNCTINGQIFLYAYTSDIFNKCTFNQNSSNAYNVWTYGAKAVEFNDCTFNSAGKSVFVYNEGGNGTALKVDDCEFNASAVVEGKAAIEIDSSLLKEGMAFDIDVENSTAIGFDNGSMSGNSLWNNKKGDKEEVTTQNSTTQTALSAENNSTTVTYGEKPVANVEKADGTVFADATDAKKWCAYKFEITPTGNSITVEVASEKGKLTSEPKPIANIDKATTVVIGVTAVGVESLDSITVNVQ